MAKSLNSSLARLCIALPLSVAGALAVTSCSLEAGDSSEYGGSDNDLTQGTDQGGLWQSKTVGYCFERPLLGSMPSSVRSRVGTQADLDQRFERRKQEFIGAINATWQAVGVLNLVPQSNCGSGMLVIHYNRDTPTGGYAGIGRRGSGIYMDSEFLGETYRWGANTYHTFVAAHEFGHALGFRHEQDRADSPCKESQDFSGTGIPLTGYDANSIMNYCARQVTGLTELDKEGFRRAYAFLGDTGGSSSCTDQNQYCGYWADHGECTKSSAYMLQNCCASCNAAAPHIVSRHSGKCMDVSARGTADGTNIQLWTCNGTGAQSFILRDVGGGYFNIVNTNSNKCVDISRSGTANGTNVQLWTCNGTGAQAFRTQDMGGGFVYLINANSGKCIDVSEVKTADGQNIHQWDCVGGLNQQWRIE